MGCFVRDETFVCQETVSFMHCFQQLQMITSVVISWVE
jgi:hypothetical protein